MDRKPPRRKRNAPPGNRKEPSPPLHFEVAPQERINDHPDVLADVMLRICELEPHEYALSDESLLSDLDPFDTDELFASVRRIYGVDVPKGRDEPFLWQVIEQIAARRRP